MSGQMRRAIPAEEGLDRIRHDVDRLGVDARRDMALAQATVDAHRARLVDMEYAARALVGVLRRAQYGRVEMLPAHVRPDFDHRGRPIPRLEANT